MSCVLSHLPKIFKSKCTTLEYNLQNYKLLFAHFLLPVVTMQGYVFTAKMLMLQNIPKHQMEFALDMNGPLHTLFFIFSKTTPSVP